MKKLLYLLSTNNITYSIVLLPESVLGYFHNDSDGSFILINQSIENNIPLHRCVLAEEIGHYFTTVGINEPLNSILYASNLSILKQEEKAIKWATDFLINTDSLLKYISSNIQCSFNDLIDFFNVTDIFMKEKLKFMSLEHLYWHITDSHYLCLANLPNIFITSRF
ncbi:ImmA/IrrE family metallo-endopeptidase [Helicovermis profundi]|uniref:IrrE N-terminal-like domain-containing protein n=1 Tax=Helicovermis profundi TaxID=3065157 RepID=A0AAU9E2T7_9FIRM|nr:hypothetical protein HLPR_11120 [Clostridia bacterium S502]